MFQSLDTKDLKIVLNAMEEKKFEYNFLLILILEQEIG